MNAKLTRRAALVAAGIAIAALLGWLLTARGVLAPMRVTVEAAHQAPLTLSTFGIGTVEARRAYSVGPTSASRILRVLVDQGDSVKAGQLIAELDPVDLDERVASARIAAERSANTVAAAQAQLEEARSRATLADASARRVAELSTQGFFSQEAADAKQHEARAARAASEAAQALLAAARRDRERAESDLAAIGRLRAQARLLSPADAVISARLAEPGSTVAAGQAIVQLIDPTSLWVRARIDQGQAGAVRIGQAASVALRSDPARSRAGEVRRVDRVSDSVTEERIVNVAFTESAASLSIGELVEVTIDLSVIHDALSVPTAAIRRVDGRDGVWRVRDGRTAFQSVRLGTATPQGRSQILSGLEPGDEVIVHSEKALKPDARIKIVDALVPARS